MIKQRFERFWWRAAAIVAVVTVLLVLSLSGKTLLFPERSAASMEERNDANQSPDGTPIARATEPDPLDTTLPDGASSDPLDGDPLDGNPIQIDSGVNDQAIQEIMRSGRPNDQPSTLAAYDEDPATVWIPEPNSDETWFWVDLGRERQLRSVHWLAQGAGEVEVDVSIDQQRWHYVDRAEVIRGWQGIRLRDEARYIRFRLLPNDGGELPAIAEAIVYGSEHERIDSVSSEQKATRDRVRKRDRKPQGDRGSASEQKADGEDSTGDEPKGGKKSGAEERVRISTEAGETRCSGNRERCEARQGEVSVEETCEEKGACTIDVRADGGTAICDASGGDQTEAGDGEGRRGGRGGRCEAVANGGSVTIGVIDP